MDIRILESNKKPGVYYAVTQDGVELPVVDITNPAFEPGLREPDLPGFIRASVRYMEMWARLPGFARRLMAGRSIFTDQSSHEGGGFVTGMATYLMKLGEANLGEGYARQWDHRMANSLPMISVQLRLRAVARLLADGLAARFSSERLNDCPLHLVNIAGGSAADSWNALLLIQKEHPQWLRAREILIRVLDLDEAGPEFGRRAFAVLTRETAPLHGLNIAFERVPYNWSNPSDLRNAVADLGAGGAILAGSSEGGLFEYGTDAEMLSNLQVLRAETPDDFFLVGSLFRNERLTRAMKRIAAMAYFLRDEQPFRELICRAGWGIEQAWTDNPVYWAVRLGKQKQ